MTYDLPRWHMDGNYYQPYNFNLPKFAATLKGDATFFYPPTEVERKDVINYAQDDERGLLASHLNQKRIAIAEYGFGCFFRVGDPLHAAVHSEPPIQQERLFLSMVCGSAEQIADLKTRWDR